MSLWYTFAATSAYGGSVDDKEIEHDCDMRILRQLKRRLLAYVAVYVRATDAADIFVLMANIGGWVCFGRDQPVIS